MPEDWGDFLLAENPQWAYFSSSPLLQVPSRDFLQHSNSTGRDNTETYGIGTWVKLVLQLGLGKTQ